MSQDERQSQTPLALKNFGRSLGTHLPARLSQLRKLGKATRALPRARVRKTER